MILRHFLASARFQQNGDEDRAGALVGLPRGGGVDRPAHRLLIGPFPLRLDHDGQQPIPGDGIGHDHHAVRCVLLRPRLPPFTAVGARGHVAHVLRTEVGFYRRREREGPDVAQQLHAERRILTDEFHKPVMLNRRHTAPWVMVLDPTLAIMNECSRR